MLNILGLCGGDFIIEVVMNVKEFKNMVIDDAWEFESYWKASRDINPEWFPEEFDEAEWFEQFLCWLQTKRQ